MLKVVAGGSVVPLATHPTAAQNGSITVTILETNTPVETGAVLEVTAEIEYTGDETIGTDAVLVVGHDPTVVGSQSIQLEPNDSQTVELTFETATVDNDQEFPVWVVVDDAVDQTSVFVYADEPPVEVTILGTNDPVSAGSVLEVMAELENNAGSETTQDVALVVGHDPQQVDSTSITVGPNDRETVTLTFETATVDNDQEFPVRVEADSDADEVSVLVTADRAPVTVDIIQSTDPVAAGDELQVTAQLDNTGEQTVTEEIVFIVGHDPEQVDSETVTLQPDVSQLITLGFETATVKRTQEFPVRVESEHDADERIVKVIGTDDDPVETDVSFPSCTRAEVSGTFGAGDNVAASTGFYDEANGDALYGNTRIEDGIEIGTDIDAPFSGTIVFEIGDGRSLSETSDGVRVEVPDYGDLGTVLTGITLPPDYRTATITHSNPQAESCLNEIEDRAGADEPTLAVSITGTNAPVRAGAFLEVTAHLENTGGDTASQTVRLIVGHDPQQVDSVSVSLEQGASETVTLGYDTYPAAQTTEFPVRVESEDDADVRTVEVIGTEAEPAPEL